MAISDYKNKNNIDLGYEDPIDQWLCSQCFKTVSSSRPPVFNPENCSCVEVAGGGPPSPREVEQPLYHYENTTSPNPLYHNRAQSYASSALSFRGPEGPEREGVDMHLNNNYLPPGPDTGLSEIQHRGPASFESDMSYQMRRFLVEDGYHQQQQQDMYSTEREARLPQQDIKIRYGRTTSKKVHKGSKPSWVSVDSGGRGSNEESAWSWSGDPTVMTGAWMDDYGLTGGYGGVETEKGIGEVYEYPMVMSGVTERGFGDGRN